jgi:hypothetical protein
MGSVDAWLSRARDAVAAEAALDPVELELHLEAPHLAAEGVPARGDVE